MTAARSRKIWIMEGQWYPSVTDRSSVAPAIQVLDHLGITQSIRRHLNTSSDLYQAFQDWGKRRHKTFGIGYLALHGSPGSVWVGEEKIPLRQLAGELEGRGVDLSGKVLHTGSCGVLRSRAGAEALIDATGISLVTGYTRNVDWVEGMALDLLVMDSLSYYSRRSDALRRVNSKYKTLAEHLGFTYITSKSK